MRNGIGRAFHRAVTSVYSWIALVVVVFIGIFSQRLTPPEALFLDPGVAAAYFNDCCPAYYGAVSNLGVIIWFLTAGALLLAAAVMSARKSEAAGFFFTGAFLTGYLGADDLYRLHETAFPHFGVAEPIVLAMIGISACAYFLLNWRRMFTVATASLIASCICFAASIGIDVQDLKSNRLALFAEDGLKFVGICMWAHFHFAQTAAAFDA